MIHYLALTTGSCGNCYVIYNGKESLVIDDGVTFKKLNEELIRHEIPPQSICGMFLTHLHPDHAKGVGVFQRKTGITVFVSPQAMKNGKEEMKRQRFEMNLTRSIECDKKSELGTFSITPFLVSHDSPGAVGYLIETNDKKLFFLTDTGVIPPIAYSFAKESEVLFVESNYEARMLDCGPYPEWLKKRIKGTYGHLSNDEAISFTNECAKRGDSVYFIHLSANNNDASLLKKRVKEEIQSGIFMKVAERGEMFEGFLE